MVLQVYQSSTIFLLPTFVIIDLYLKMGGFSLGIFDGMMGNASEIGASEAEKEISELLTETEKVAYAYKLVRDLIVFTNKRLIFIDKQGMTGKKVAYHSIPYKSITHFSIETAGRLDLEAELKIWIAGSGTPIEKTFNKQLNIYHVQRVLSEYVN